MIFFLLLIILIVLEENYDLDIEIFISSKFTNSKFYLFFIKNLPFRKVARVFIDKILKISIMAIIINNYLTKHQFNLFSYFL